MDPVEKTEEGIGGVTSSKDEEPTATSVSIEVIDAGNIGRSLLDLRWGIEGFRPVLSRERVEPALLPAQEELSQTELTNETNIQAAEKTLTKTLGIEIFIDKTGHYKSLPCARELFVLAARRNPDGALGFLDRSPDFPYRDEVLNEALRTASRDSVINYGGNMLEEPQRELFLRQAYEASPPKTQLDEFLHVKSYDWSTDILSTAAESVAEHSPSAIMFLHAEEMKYIPNGEELLLKCVRELQSADTSSTHFFELRDIIDNDAIPFDKQPYKEMLREAALKDITKDPLFFIGFERLLEGCPWAEEVLTISYRALAETDPGRFLSLASHGRLPEYALEHVRDATTSVSIKSPEELLRSDTYNFLRDKPWAEDLIYTAVGNLSPEQRQELLGITEYNSPPTERQKTDVSNSLHLAERVIRNGKEALREKFERDPAFPTAIRIGEQWIDPSITDDEQRAQYRMMVARRLDSTGSELTSENIEATYKEIRDIQDRFGDVPLFQDRNVILAAHNERWDIGLFGKERFGTAATRRAIDRESRTFSFHQGEEDLGSLLETKASLLEAIRNTPPPMTFYFDGHGNSHSIALSDGQVSDEGFVQTENSCGISSRELAEALGTRRAKFPELNSSDPNMEDLLIISSCHSHDFILDVNNRLQRSQSSLPIAISSTEFGQYSYSDVGAKYGGSFDAETIGLERIRDVGFLGSLFRQGIFGAPASYVYNQLRGNTFSPTVGTVIDNEDKTENSNPSVFVPDSTEEPIQISRNGQKLNSLTLPKTDKA